MSDPVSIPRMTADEFIAWAMERPETEHYELAGGEVIAMAPERITHSRAKYHIARRLTAAIEAAGLDCEAFIDGLAVVVDANTVYEPDVLVRCGEELDGDTVRISDPVIVVEVLSRSTKGRDTGAKLADYFRLPSVRGCAVRGSDQASITPDPATPRSRPASFARVRSFWTRRGSHSPIRFHRSPEPPGTVSR